MIRHFRSRQFALFLLTGGIAAGVNLGSRVVYDQWLSFSQAVILAYLTGMLCAFLLARRYVFPLSGQPLHRSILAFGTVNLLALAQTWLVSLALAYWLLPALGVDSYRAGIAHFIGVAVPAFTSYLGHKYWSFRPLLPEGAGDRGGPGD